MKSILKQLMLFAATAVMSLIFYDLILSEESKDMYWETFNSYFNRIVLEDSGNQGLDMSTRYDTLFHSAQGEVYRAGD